MMDKKLLIFLIAFPILSILLSISIFNSKNEEQLLIDFPQKNKKKKIADSFINHANIINYDKLGKQKNVIIAEKLLHYPGDIDSELIKPDITLFRLQGSPIVITADHGFTNQQGTRIILTGHVIITRENSQDNQFFQLKSPTLTIWPNKEFVETDKDVLITTENSTINSVGMKAYLDVEHYLFLSRVKAIHKPIKR